MSDDGKRPVTGDRPGPTARKKESKPDGPAGEYSAHERRVGRYVRRSYVINRSAFESAKHGCELIWKVPKSYDGDLRPSNDPQDAKKQAKNVWYVMARWFVTRNIDGPAFIQYVFARLDLSHRIPEPLQVCSDDLVPGFRKHVTEGVVEDISKSLEAQTRTAQAEMEFLRDAFGSIDPNRAVGKKWVIVQNVICQQHLSLTPLFRYLLALSSAKEAGDENDEAAQYRFLELARGLYDRAAFQFCANKEAYSEHWKRWLPKRFPAEAEARFRQLAFNEETNDEDEVV